MTKQFTGRRKDSRFVLEELEARQLFSGGIEGLIVTETESAIATYLDIDSNVEPGETLSSEASIAGAEQQTHEIAFVDAGIENYQTLVDDLLNNADPGRNIEVVLLDSERSGIEQISAALQDRDDLDAIHIISHGSDGSVQLGNSSLDAEALTENYLEISLWANAFSDTGDILIYGCNLAASEVGQDLIIELGAMTLADVAASDDLTGATALGGDWDLELNVGSIESAIAISSDAQQTWRSVLATNQEPVNTLPGMQTTNENTILLFSSGNGNQISISDTDAGGAVNEITLTATNGNLTLAGTAGLSFVTGDGTADTTMTFRGTVSDINTALDGLGYSPDVDYNGSSTLTISTKDSVLLSLDIDAGLLGHYDFENAGALGTDTSPATGYTGTVNGATAVVDGIRGSVLNLDGNDYLQTTGHFGDPANVTLAAWVNLSATDTKGSHVISLGDSVLLTVDEPAGGNGVSGVFYNGTTWVKITSGQFIEGTGWHHVAFTYDDAGNEATLFLDGTAVVTTSTTDSISYTQGADSFIGKHGNGLTEFDFTGQIDDARIYDRVLSANEVATLASDLAMVDTDSVAISVNAVPIATGNTVIASEDLPLVISASDFNFTDAEGDSLASVTITGLNLNGGTLTHTGGSVNVTNGMTITAAQLADLSFTSALNDSTDSSFTYSVNDAGSGVTSAIMNITVNAVNDVPVAVTDSAVTNEDTSVNINLLTNDSDAEGDPMFVLDVGNPANGTVVNNGDGTVTYTPDTNFSGADSFTYLVSDLNGISSYWGLDGNATDSVGGNNGTITGTTTVAGVNGNALSFDKVDDKVVVPNFTINDSFSLSFQIKIDDNSGADYQYIYSHGPVNNPNSLNIFLGETGSGYANMLYTQFNDANDIDDRTALEFDLSSIIGDGLWHTYTLTVASGSGSTVYLDGTLQNSDARGGDSFNPTTDIYLGTREDMDPNRFFGGSLDSVQIFDRALDAGEVSDVHTGGTSLGTVNITVNAVNDAGTFGGTTSATTNEDTATAGTVTFADTADGFTTANFSLNTAASNGVATIDAAGNWTYTPTSNYNGADSFTVQVTDDDGNVETQVISITVNAVNDVPVNTVPAAQTVNEDTALVFSAANGNQISVGDVDSTSSPLQVTLSSTNGQLTLNQIDGLDFMVGSGTADTTMTFIGTTAKINAALNGLSFDPATNFYGAAEIQIQTSDLASEVIGNDTVLGSNTTAGDYDKEQIATQISIAENGTITSISAHLYIDKTEDIRFGLYSDAAGEPDTLLAESIAASQIAGTNWYTIDIPDTVVTAGDYWIAMDIGKEGGYFYDATGGQTRHSNYDPNLGLEPAWTGTYASNTQSISVYANLTADGATPLSDSDTIAITIDPVNDVPVATGNTVIASEDVSLVIGASDFNFTDVEGDSLASVTITGLNLNGGTLTHSGGTVPVTNGMTITAAQLVDLTFTSASNDSTNSSFTYTVNDADSGVTSAIMNITVNPVNDAGTFGGTTSATTNEDTATAGTVTFADTADGFTTANFSLNTAASNGVAAIDAAGNWTYTPGANYNGADSFTVQVTDDDGNVETQVISLTVTPINDAGTFGGTTSATTDEETATAGTVTFTDTADGFSTANFSLNTAASNGVATIDTAGNWTYTPTSNYNGADSFTVQVTDDDGNVETQVISIAVTSVNDAGTFGGTTSATTNEDTATAGTVTFADTADGFTTANFSLNTAATNGVAAVDAAGNWSYTPNANYNGSDSFTVQVTDDDGNVETQVISITVTPINDAGTFGGNTSATTNEDTATAGTVTFADTADGFTTANFSLNTAATNGVASIDAAGNWTYTPSANYNGADSFTVQVTDDDGNVETQVISITVTAVNDAAMIAGVDTGSVQEDVGVIANNISTSGLLTIADPDTGESSFQAATVNGTYGDLTIDTAGNWTYVADNTQAAIQQLDAGESMTDSVIVTALDGTMHNVVITINGAEDTPVFDSTAVTAATEDSLYSYTISTSDVDIETLTISAPSLPAWLSFVDNGDGTASLSGTPGSAEVGNHNVVLNVSDGTLNSSQVFTITVNNAAPAPVVTAPPVMPPPIEPIVIEDTSEDPAPEPIIIGQVSTAGGDDVTIPEAEPGDVSSENIIALETDDGPIAQSGAETLPTTASTPDRDNAKFNHTPVNAKAQELLRLKALQEQQANLSTLNLYKDTAIEIDALEESALWASIDNINRQLDTETSGKPYQQVEVQILAGSTASLTAGFVSWVLRGGSLLASMMSSVPVLNRFDPLPILKSRNDKENFTPEGEEDSTESTQLTQERKVDRLFSHGSVDK